VTARSFVRLAEAMAAGRAEDPEALLTLIAHGMIVDEQRAAYKRPVPVGLDVVEPGTRGFIPPALATFPHEFNEALRALPDEQRDAFILTELRGLTVREAASELGVSKSALARHSEAATTALKKELA
jgi:DNA-directed RNA polymerase specialized sigma24 family protein